MVLGMNSPCDFIYYSYDLIPTLNVMSDKIFLGEFFFIPLESAILKIESGEASTKEHYGNLTP